MMSNFNLPQKKVLKPSKYMQKQKPQGYNCTQYFYLGDTESLDKYPKRILIHRNTGGIVLDMLSIFDVISWPLSPQKQPLWSQILGSL
jgi:hypothetical protein